MSPYEHTGDITDEWTAQVEDGDRLRKWKGSSQKSGPDQMKSIQAIQIALEIEVNFFDTAAVCGCGHSEHILGKA